ncbi:MAG: FtsQ-type POTRA domain-containing protein [Firmicutes bacterium]|nr:FtsQ-type POTRA domain-containing protein [Bacillota bacterium]MBQ9708924.1 FtsQ-type POTRA domain-containing protein [Bacillota bacterium]
MAEENKANVMPEVNKKGRKKRKKRKKSKNYLLRIVIALGLVVAAFAVLHIDYFTVKEVNVSGNDYLTDAQVLKGTELKKGNNIFDVHLIFEKGKIKENLYIQDVKLSRKLPNIINVTVNERVGLAQFTMGEKYVVTDNEGTVIEVAKERREITLVKGLEAINAQKGQKVKFKDDKGYDKIMELLAATSEGDMFFKSLELKDGRVKATVYSKIKVEGAYSNVIESLGSGALKTVVYDLYQKGKKKGTIIVSGDNYCSFTE